MSPSLGREWAKPGVFEVADGVHRIPLPLPLRGLPAVNVYVVAAADGPVLIDAGWSGDEPAHALEDGLRQLGVGLNEVSQILVTHAHWDHYLHAVELQQQIGTSIALGAGEKASVTDVQERPHALLPEQLPMLRRAGAADLAAQLEAHEPAPHERDVPHELPDRWIDDGETVAVDGGVIEAVATPGHTHGHVVFRHSPSGLLFTGDHVLPGVTPAIGFERCVPAAPLADYLESLERTKAMTDLTMAPAHGAPGASVSTRSAELIAHHEDRLDEIEADVRSGCSTAGQIAAKMRWTSSERALSDLELTHQMNAVLEVAAHLEVLRRRGLVSVTDVDGVDVVAAV